jgi:hypothetical protein
VFEIISCFKAIKHVCRLGWKWMTCSYMRHSDWIHQTSDWVLYEKSQGRPISRHKMMRKRTWKRTKLICMWERFTWANCNPLEVDQANTKQKQQVDDILCDGWENMWLVLVMSQDWHKICLLNGRRVLRFDDLPECYRMQIQSVIKLFQVSTILPLLMSWCIILHMWT